MWPKQNEFYVVSIGSDRQLIFTTYSGAYRTFSLRTQKDGIIINGDRMKIISNDHTIYQFELYPGSHNVWVCKSVSDDDMEIVEVI